MIEHRPKWRTIFPVSLVGLPLLLLSRCADRAPRTPDASSAASSELTETCDQLRNHLDRFAETYVLNETSCRLEGSVPLPQFDWTVDPLESLRDSLIDSGWTDAVEFSADGPGTSSYRLVRKNVFCQVGGGAPAWIDDDHEIRQAESYTVRVECHESD